MYSIVNLRDKLDVLVALQSKKLNIFSVHSSTRLLSVTLPAGNASDSINLNLAVYGNENMW